VELGYLKNSFTQTKRSPSERPCDLAYTDIWFSQKRKNVKRNTHHHPLVAATAEIHLNGSMILDFDRKSSHFAETFQIGPAHQRDALRGVTSYGAKPQKLTPRNFNGMRTMQLTHDLRICSIRELENTLNWISARHQIIRMFPTICCRDAFAPIHRRNKDNHT